MSQEVTLLFTSDTHGHWVDRPDNHGQSLKDTASTLLEIKASLNHPVITFDLGDFIQGSALATYFAQEKGHGEIFAKAMNAIGYDYQIIGNHEFNFGNDYRDQILSQLNAKILAANIVDAITLQPLYGQPYDIIEISGIKFGILGVTTSFIKNWELPKNYQGIEFLDAFETTKKYVEQLRPQVDVLIVAYHGGIEKDLMTFEPIEPQTGENQGARMLEEIPGIDILLTGHQHREICQMVGQTAVLQAGYGGEFIGQVDLQLDDHHQIVKYEIHLHPILKSAQVQAKIQQAILPEVEEGEAWLQTIIGNAGIISPTSDVFLARLMGHPYAEFLNQLQLKETGAQFSGIAIVNEAFSDFVGPISNEKLLLSYPFYNLIAKVLLTGQDLYEIMEYNLRYFTLNSQGQLRVNPKKLSPKPQHYNYDLYSGFTTIVDFSQPFGSRVVQLIDEKTHQPLNLDQTYEVAVSQYRSVGGGHYHWFTKDKVQSISEIDIASLMHQAIQDYTIEDWDQINGNYQHLQMLEPLIIAEFPMVLEGFEP